MSESKFKKGDWVRLRTDINIVWNENCGEEQRPVPAELANTVFVVRDVSNSGDIYIRPHELFAGLFGGDAWYDLQLNGENVFDFYYPDELVLVENLEDEQN